MPVDTKHPDYVKLAPAWLMMRRLAAGQRAVHAATVDFLPKLSGEPDDRYNARLARTGLYNATWRTIEGFVGMLFRKAPTREIPAAIEKMLDDVTKSGVPMDKFAERIAKELETVGRVGVLVDHPPAVTPVAPGQVVTVAQVEALNIRPHMAEYKTEAIVNWRHEWINNRTELALLVLEESAVIGGDRFAPKHETRWRVLELVPDQDGHVYQQQVWRKNDNGDFEQVGGDNRPTINGKPLREIPFEIFGDGLPPLEDLGHVNKSHFMTTGDIEHGAHWTALPQHYVTGVTQGNDEQGRPIKADLTIGAGDCWIFDNTETKVGIVEYTGQGLGALENRLIVKEKYMAVLGGRMLEAQKSGVESAETAGIHRSSEQSVLQSHADILSMGFERLGRWFAAWAGVTDGKFVYRVNKDFMPSKLGAQELTALVGAFQAGAMSFDELFWNLQTGGRVSDGADSETEQTKIANAAPIMVAAPPANQPAKDDE